jgi:hypothetical protein
MKIEVTTDINAPIDAVWTLLADDFTSIQTWSDSVFTSNPLEVTGPNGAPVGGRYCTFTDDPDGFAARETITTYDKASWTLAFDVDPVNAPKAIPLVRNHVTVILEQRAPNETRLRWVTEPELKSFAYVMYPLIKIGLRKSFKGIVAELKAFAEGDGAQRPHLGAA